MRYNLLSFVCILFLDAMKRQMNEFSWTHGVPIVKNKKMKIVMYDEAIVTSEDIDTYA